MAHLRPTLDRARSQLPALAGFAAPFLLVLVLALESGGYDLTPRSQVGIVVWWAVLIGVAAGLLPVIRVTRSGWTVLGIMTALSLWTALAALTWTQGQERSIVEVSRDLALLGILFALILLQGKDGLRRSIAGLGAATVVVAILALLSRYHPAWFDLGEFPANYPKARLQYPIGYWNGLATLLAMGIVSLLWSATWAKGMATRLLSAASIPLLVTAVYMTASRGGLIEGTVAIVVLVACAPGRLRLLVRTVSPAIFSVLLIMLIVARPELRDNLGGVAESQGTQMIWLTALVFLAGAGTAWLLETKLLSRVELPTVRRRTAARVGAACAGLALVVLLIGLASGFVGDKWDEFNQPVGANSSTVDRLDSFRSGERSAQWSSAIDAGETKPVTGLGPGTYEYWWSREGTGPGFVRDAHSLYLEGFAEIGIPGLLLTLALVLTPIWFAGRAAFRNARDDRRPAFAAAAAGMAAFAVAAGIDWAWELAVLPAAFFVLVAAICGPSAEIRGGRLNRPDLRLPFLLPSRLGIVAASVLALVVIAVPMVGEQRILDSQSLSRGGDLDAAIEKAKQARDIMPWSATASIQLAQLESGAGDAAAALAAARDATEQDPYSWKAWLVLLQIADKERKDAVAREATEKIVELNRNFGEQRQ